MRVKTIPFLHTMSQHVKLRTSEYLKNREKEILMLEVKGAMNVHSSNGFSVEALDRDLEFKCIKNKFIFTFINIVDTDAHVHPIEVSIRTVKERIRCTVQGLPFTCVPKEMVKALPTRVIRNLNQFSIKSVFF